MQRTAITGRKLSEFFPDGLFEEFAKRQEPPKESKVNRRILRECAAIVMTRPDKGIGRKRPRKCRCKLGSKTRRERVNECRELGKIALRELSDYE